MATDPLSQMVVTFEGGHSRAAIKEKLDTAMKLYGLKINDENYSRAGSVLVTLRQFAQKRGRTDVTEMRLLDYMIRSHVPELNIDFPSMAGMANAFLISGDK